MSKKYSFGFLAGVIVGAVAAIVLSIGHATPRALAQAQPTQHALVNRYQVSAWAYPGTANISNATHGAYILDTQSGRVWVVDVNQKPQPIGSVE